ncbi:hypothetical protein V2J09_023519 [Rumex salicifolius]
MGSFPGSTEKAHVVCVPYPAQGHINPMMKLAKLLHSHAGFHVTFVHTEYNHARLLHSLGPRALDGLPSFRFATIPDGLNSDPAADSTQDIPSICASVDRHSLGPFKDLLVGLNDGSGPRVTCIVADVAMPFTLTAAEDLGIKEVLLWTASACGFLAYDQYPALIRQGYTPLKDASQLTNGYLETPIEWIPSMQGIQLKDIPTFIRTTDPQDIMLNYLQLMFNRSRTASAIIFNTFDAFEHDVLAALAPDFPPLYTVGPLHKLVDRLVDPETASIPSSLWKEDKRCVDWLDSQPPGSVVYVNFGSITVMTNLQLVEFALGLAGSGKRFLWIIRPDLVSGETAVLPPEFVSETSERGLMAEWCEQERVLAHRAVGGFLTHSGWNSVVESVCSGGVAMVSWPFFAEQQTNCWYSCGEWGIGMEIDSEVRRDVVEKQVRELMDGDKGKELKKKALEWKGLADEAIAVGKGESWLNLENLIGHILASPEEIKK